MSCALLRYNRQEIKERLKRITDCRGRFVTCPGSQGARESIQENPEHGMRWVREYGWGHRKYLGQVTNLSLPTIRKPFL